MDPYVSQSIFFIFNRNYQNIDPDMAAVIKTMNKEKTSHST